MRASDDHLAGDIADAVGDGVEPTLPPRAQPHHATMSRALARYRASVDRAELERALAAATALVAELRDGGGRAPDLEELRDLARAMPRFGQVLSAAADEADRTVRDATQRLWRDLGLHSGSPSWNPSERDAARMVFACACAPAQGADSERLRASLHQIAAGRFAAELCAELARSERVWLKALADRYGSVRHRYARRTPWRSLGLAELIRADDSARRAVTVRLERWLAGGGHAAALAGELEAALVHTRTPSKFA